jgi:hypothetical protein
MAAQDNGSTSFRYTRLKDHEFRLLHLKWATNAAGERVFPPENGAIECSLTTHSLDPNDSKDDIQYTALSYCWGEVEPSHQVLLNGHTFSIRDNPFRFLSTAKPDNPEAAHHVRQELQDFSRLFAMMGLSIAEVTSSSTVNFKNHGSRGLGYVWVDAVCINQEDAVEKARQLAIMKDIYTRARRIIIWLGSSDERTDRVMDLLRWLADGTIPFNINASDMQDLYHWSCLPWWSRMWVIQEASTPNVLRHVWCGDRTLDYTDIDKVRERLQAVDVSNMSIFMVPRWPFPTALLRIEASRAEHREARRYEWVNTDTVGDTLLWLLHMTRYASASDPRDKIFALIPLLQEAHPNSVNSIPIDYNIAIDELWRSVAILIMETTQDLEILVHCSLQLSSKKHSWAPNWSVLDQEPSKEHSPPGRNHYLMSPRVAALFRASAGAKLLRRLDSMGTQLTVRGKLVDRIGAMHCMVDIEDTSDLRPRFPTPAAVRQYIDESFRKLLNFFIKSTDSKVMPGKDMQDAIMRTLLLDVHMDSKADDILRGVDPELTFDKIFWSDASEESMKLKIRARFHEAAIFFRTSRQRIGMACPGLQCGDAVVVLYGVGIPLLLRECEKGWIIVGQCYCDGVMDGEAVLDEEMMERAFVLV